MAEEKKTKKEAGVVETIQAILTRKTGLPLETIVDELSKRFPDRNPDSMKATVRVQLSRNTKNIIKEKLEGKPITYRWKA